MAKAEMMCPFSGKPCKECPIYRGRHYYLCFSERYRGHVKGVEEDNNTRASLEFMLAKGEQFKVPAKTPSAIDPFTVPMSDISK